MRLSKGVEIRGYVNNTFFEGRGVGLCALRGLSHHINVPAIVAPQAITSNNEPLLSYISIPSKPI